MGDQSNAVYWIVVLLAIVFVLWKILQRGRKRVAVKEAIAGVAHAEAVQRQAEEDLRIAAKYAKGESLTDDELLSLSYFAVKSGIATPQQEQLVRTAEVLRVSKEKLAQTEAISRT